MKIVCCWLSEVMRDYSTPSYEQVHYFQTLKRMGHDVKVIPIVPMKSSDSQILDVVNMWKPDVLMVKFYREEIRKETIDYISMFKKTVTVGIFGDDEKYFKRDGYNKEATVFSDEYAPCCNWVVTTYKPAIEWYNRIGIDNVIHSCYGANHWEYKKLRLKKIFDVSFCGAKNPERISICNQIALAGLKLKVYGNGWNDNSILSQADYPALFNRTKVNFNISVDRVGHKRIKQIKGRDFEVPMCGGFFINRENELLEEFFKPGKEIETYDSVQELIDKIKYYLKNDSKRDIIAQRGYERARKHHTYVKRFTNIFNQMGLKC